MVPHLNVYHFNCNFSATMSSNQKYTNLLIDQAMQKTADHKL